MSGECGQRTAVCGNGAIEGDEECDDLNTVADDGCTDCEEDLGFNCVFLASGVSDCSGICGDGIVTSDEACDDDNETDGDGCSAGCDEVEDGWQCNTISETSECSEVCGDGIITVNEACDDNNTEDDDGCTFLCEE